MLGFHLSAGVVQGNRPLRFLNFLFERIRESPPFTQMFKSQIVTEVAEDEFALRCESKNAMRSGLHSGENHEASPHMYECTNPSDYPNYPSLMFHKRMSVTFDNHCRTAKILVQ